MVLTKRARAELPEPQLVAEMLKAARANVRGRAFMKRNIVFSKRQFWWWAKSWDALIVRAGFTGLCKSLY
jgi:hypothetical protein